MFKLLVMGVKDKGQNNKKNTGSKTNTASLLLTFLAGLRVAMQLGSLFHNTMLWGKKNDGRRKPVFDVGIGDACVMLTYVGPGHMTGN